MKKKSYFLIFAGIIILSFVTGCQSYETQASTPEPSAPVDITPAAGQIISSNEFFVVSFVRPYIKGKKEQEIPDLPLPLPGLDRLERVMIYQCEITPPLFRFDAPHRFPIPTLEPPGKYSYFKSLHKAELPILASLRKQKSEGKEKRPETDPKPKKIVSIDSNDLPEQKVIQDKKDKPVQLSEDVFQAEREEAKHREIFARKGDRLEIGLEGKGWLFLGPAEGKSLDAVSFISNEYKDNNSFFSFQALEYGEYELMFQLQNNTLGTIQIEVVHLRVVPEEEFSALLAESSRIIPEIKRDECYAYAEKLFSLGEMEAALIEFIKDYREGDPYLDDRIATIYAKTGEHEAAVKFFKKNLETNGEYADSAVLGLMRSSLARKDSDMLLEYLDAVLSMDSKLIDKDILEVARFQKECRRYAVAFDLLDEYVHGYPGGSYLDEAYFLLAQLYELDSPYRDLKKSGTVHHIVI
ncbi:hypothetical protein ES705_29595 [subsurface metagenome]